MPKVDEVWHFLVISRTPLEPLKQMLLCGCGPLAELLLGWVETWNHFWQSWPRGLIVSTLTCIVRLARQ